ncbi:MAG: hypothetical protein ACRC57_07280 [Sarcina sp.]
MYEYEIYIDNTLVDIALSYDEARNLLDQYLKTNQNLDIYIKEIEVM